MKIRTTIFLLITLFFPLLFIQSVSANKISDYGTADDVPLPVEIGDDFPSNSSYNIHHCNISDARKRLSTSFDTIISVCYSDQYTYKTQYGDISQIYDSSYYVGFHYATYSVQYWYDGTNWQDFPTPNGHYLYDFYMLNSATTYTTNTDSKIYNKSASRSYYGFGTWSMDTTKTVGYWNPVRYIERDESPLQSTALPFYYVFLDNLDKNPEVFYKYKTSERLYFVKSGTTFTLTGQNSVLYQNTINAPTSFTYRIDANNNGTITESQNYNDYVYKESTNDHEHWTTVDDRVFDTGSDDVASICAYKQPNGSAIYIYDTSLNKLGSCFGVVDAVEGVFGDIIDDIAEVVVPLIPTCEAGDFWCWITSPILQQISNLTDWLKENTKNTITAINTIFYPDPIQLIGDYISFQNKIEETSAYQLSDELTGLLFVTPIAPQNLTVSISGNNVTILDWQVFDNFYSGNLKNIASAFISLIGLATFISIYKYIYDN